MTVEIWEENYTTFNVFNAMVTQWRHSMNGVIGMDYCALPAVMEMMNVDKSEWSQIFSDIRLMETVALKELNKKDD